jgi:flagellar basal body-associated protein FliL
MAGAASDVNQKIERGYEMEAVLAWIVIMVGLVVLLFGVAGGILQMFAEMKKSHGQTIGVMEFPGQIIDALIKFVEALAKAPLWLALVAIGLFLLIWGASLL